MLSACSHFPDRCAHLNLFDSRCRMLLNAEELSLSAMLGCRVRRRMLDLRHTQTQHRQRRQARGSTNIRTTCIGARCWRGGEIPGVAAEHSSSNNNSSSATVGTAHDQQRQSQPANSRSQDSAGSHPHPLRKALKSVGASAWPCAPLMLVRPARLNTSPSSSSSSAICT